MPMNMDDEILQDFLVEAGEILESLSEQLIELERCPTDKNLLNSVFRGFHTLKGGAGFLNITPLVDICHCAEDVFNTLRQGERQVDSGLMDEVLKVLDIVNRMMGAVRVGQDPEPANANLLDILKKLATPEVAHADEIVMSVSMQERLDEVGQECEALLKESQASSRELLEKSASVESQAALPASDAGASNEITEEEFEALLDKLHGKGSQPKSISPQAALASDNVGETSIGHTSNKHVVGELLIATKPASDEKSHVASDDTKDHDKDGKDATAQADTTVRIDTKRLDDIMNLVGELVLVRNRLAALKESIKNEEVGQVVGNLDVVTSDLQAAVMKMRMQPIKKVFNRFPRVVRDLSRALNKEIHLELTGEDTDLDKTLVEALSDPLVHLVRNSIDHGIEIPDIRKRNGKSSTGTIALSAKQEGDYILLSIKDDGAGMSAEKLRRKAVEKGLIDEEAAARLDAKECHNLIFLPGFSTKAEISNISGRGVGMDVVKTRISQLNGSVEISSQEGVGTEITLKLPLTLAIVPTLMVMLGNQIFAIPLANVNEIIEMSSVKTNVVEGKDVAIIRNHPLPLFFMNQWLVREGNRSIDRSRCYVVVVKVGTRQMACVVDNLIAQEEVVIKPLGALLQGVPGLAGATITGDGRIALILDMPGLMAGYARKI